MKFDLLKGIQIVILVLPFSVIADNEFTSSGEQFGTPVDIDFRNAQPFPLPRFSRNESLLPPDNGTRTQGAPGFASGGEASKVYKNPGFVIDPDDFEISPPVTSLTLPPGGVSSQANGTSNHPYSHTRLDFGVNKLSKKKPYRSTGLLGFDVPGGTATCSASLIKRGILLTAAHCVAGFGTNLFYSNWTFVPGYKDGAAPYGVWSSTDAIVFTSYVDGTGPCDPTGVVCEHDIAVIVMAPDGHGDYPGDYTGWYSYAWNGFGYTGNGVAAGNLTQVTQLGYPGNLDDGEKMQRTDSYGITSDASLWNNTLVGSPQAQGSSGGPHIINIGKKPALGPGYTHGGGSRPNTVIGVTSWGPNDQTVKELGASPFTDTNIVPMVDFVCETYPDRC